MQDGVLIQSSGRGGEASTSGKGAAAAAKGRVAYVGAEPTDAELLKSRVADDGAARQCRFAALLVIGMLYMYSTEPYPCGNVCKIIHLIVPHLQHSSFDERTVLADSFLLVNNACTGGMHWGASHNCCMYGAGKEERKRMRLERRRLVSCRLRMGRCLMDPLWGRGSRRCSCEISRWVASLSAPKCSFEFHIQLGDELDVTIVPRNGPSGHLDVCMGIVRSHW